ncbi:MAG: hypothetical protein FD118_4258, partial [Rhodocyclaceae bacterium]
ELVRDLQRHRRPPHRRTASPAPAGPESDYTGATAGVDLPQQSAGAESQIPL